MALALPVSLAPGSSTGFCLFLLPSYTGQANMTTFVMTDAAAVVLTWEDE